MESSATELKGRIKWYNEKKAFGFITGEDGTDYFLHKTGVNPSFTPIFEGAKVVFEPATGKKGPKAVNVRLAE